MKPEEIKRGYWFYDTILDEPIQAKEDSQPDFVNLRRYKPLPITRDNLKYVGFTESPGWQTDIYEKNGFCLYYVKQKEGFYLKQFGEFREKLEFMHLLQKRFREEVAP